MKAHIQSLIPNMHSDGFGATLRRYASQTPDDQTIVEVGSWLGGGTFHLADASGPQPLHVYDKWTANESEVEKAYARGERRLKDGESFRHIVAENLSEFGERIHLHQTPDVTRAQYDEGPIGLYVDDASKNRIADTFNIFEPYFAPGCIVMLMDYFWPPCRSQRMCVEAKNWEFIEQDKFDTNCAIWRVT